MPVPPAPLPADDGGRDLSPPDAEEKSLRELSRELDGLSARAAALVAGRKAKNLQEGFHLACRTIDSGAAADKLARLVAFTAKG